MVRLALLLSSIWLFVSCNSEIPAVEIPNQFIANSDSSFRFEQGVLLYNNLPYSGYSGLIANNTDTIIYTPFLNGQEEGWSLEYYDNGKPKSKRYYKKGAKEGIHTGWWKNGQMQFLYHFKDDEFEGELKEWYASGQLYRVFNYSKGQETGIQKMWKRDGRIKANYEIKNGRRYGLVGVKNCENVWDEVDSVLRTGVDSVVL